MVHPVVGPWSPEKILPLPDIRPFLAIDMPVAALADELFKVLQP